MNPRSDWAAFAAVLGILTVLLGFALYGYAIARGFITVAGLPW